MQWDSGYAYHSHPCRHWPADRSFEVPMEPQELWNFRSERKMAKVTIS